jgi:glycosyltransferase involved in cell wall biosynthesis
MGFEFADMDVPTQPRVALVHDWLTGMRGGEKVLEIFCRQWPDASLYTLLHDPGSVSEPIERLIPKTSYLQKLPRVKNYYRYLLPLMPSAMRRPLPDCDLVVSSSHCVAKGAIAPPGALHVCYCFTPMRYAWHMRESYGWRGVKGWLVDRILNRLRDWDRRTAAGVTHFVAISREVQRRIRECYGRDSVVIYPPVETDYFTPTVHPRDDHYLVVSAFAPYKRIDIAIEACKRANRRLVIVGSGQQEKTLRTLAGPETTFLGWQSTEQIRQHYRRCRALLFPGVEDFGIVPLEAQACGTPVIAFAKGGAVETVLPLGGRAAPTGVWFDEQTPAGMAVAIEQFERHHAAFEPDRLRQHAVRFTTRRFEEEFFGFVNDLLAPRRSARNAA